MVKNLHSWDLSAKKAIELQKKLADKVLFTPLTKRPELVAGLDCAFGKGSGDITAAAVVIRLPDLTFVETATAKQTVRFPYIPGLLSFREAPACIAAVEKLKSNPDVFIIDGQGIAHPRRLGIASHLGLLLDRPAIGCAKSRLIGEFTAVPVEKGGWSPLKYPARRGPIDRLSFAAYQTIGAVVRTRTNVRPVFVSVGHRCTLEDAIKTVLACTTRYRLPEPARLAHQTVSRCR